MSKSNFILNKNIVATSIILITVFAIYLVFKNQEPRDTVEVDNLSQSINTCYEYHQSATANEPYKVDEYIEIYINDEVVSGTKHGTQDGPDMTNGYFGTLNGTIINDILLLSFNYEVEGSKNTETEEYTMTESALIKHRYVLIEENGGLVPNHDIFIKDIVYTKVLCNI